MSKDELYEKYKFLVYKVIKDLGCKYRNDDEFEEYLFWGNLGLIKAINGYDKTKISSSAFFYNSIKNSIMVLFKNKTSLKRKINYMILQSLDEPVQDQMYYTEFHEIIPDENVHIEEDIIKKSEYETLYKAINMLKPKYKKIICDYFGIKSNKRSFQEMSKDYGVTKQALSAEKNYAIRDLRKKLYQLGVKNNEW